MGFQTHVTDFVEEKRTSVRLKKLAFLVRSRRERATAMTEQLALDQVFRNGGAIHFDEHFVLARTLRVDGLRDEFLARPRFTEDEDTAVGRGHELDLLPEGFHGNALADDHASGRKLPFQVAVFQAQFLGVHRVLDQHESFVHGKRFFQEVEGAKFGGADRGFNGGVPGDDDDLGSIR